MTKKEEMKDNDAAEAKKASIATDNSFEWKSTQAHQQVATTLHSLGILMPNTNPKEIYVSLLELINRHGRFDGDIQGLCHQEEMQGNDTKTPVMNLDTVRINNHINSDAVNNSKSRVSEPWKVAKKLSILQRLERFEASIEGTFSQRMAVLEQRVHADVMKLEDRIAQLELVLE